MRINKGVLLFTAVAYSILAYLTRGSVDLQVLQGPTITVALLCRIHCHHQSKMIFLEFLLNLLITIMVMILAQGFFMFLGCSVGSAFLLAAIVGLFVPIW